MLILENICFKRVSLGDQRRHCIWYQSNNTIYLKSNSAQYNPHQFKFPQPQIFRFIYPNNQQKPSNSVLNINLCIPSQSLRNLYRHQIVCTLSLMDVYMILSCVLDEFAARPQAPSSCLEPAWHMVHPHHIVLRGMECMLVSIS